MKAEREREREETKNSRRREGCPVSFFLFVAAGAKIWRFFSLFRKNAKP